MGADRLESLTWQSSWPRPATLATESVTDRQAAEPGWPGVSRSCSSRSQAAAGRRMSVGRCGGIERPSGKSSPVSSKTMTPLHNRLHPCSGWNAMVWAASRSGRSAGGHGADVNTLPASGPGIADVFGLWGPCLPRESCHLRDWFYEDGTSCRCRGRHPKVDMLGESSTAGMLARRWHPRLAASAGSGLGSGITLAWAADNNCPCPLRTTGTAGCKGAGN